MQLLQGDCYALIKEIPDNSIDLVYIDIPYLFDSHGQGSSDLATRMTKKTAELEGYKEEFIKAKSIGASNAESIRISKNRASQKLQIANIVDGIDYSIFNELCRVMKRINIYIWCSKRQFLDIMNYFIGEKACTFDILCWCKTNASPTCNGTFLPDIEYCLFFREKGVTFNSCYDLCHKWYITQANTADKKVWGHPTIKPLQIVQKHILLSTNENDVVLDCFMGSGTTGVACVETNRDFIGIELNEVYFKSAEIRINNTIEQNKMKLF